jgi:UDP-N-acetylglucosamine 3-dehydrogenase
VNEALSTPSEVRIGILGSGWMGSVHAQCYQRIKGAKVVGVFSRNRERAEALAKVCSAKAVTESSALIEDPSVDAIDVCVPTANHVEFVVAALKHRKHVFCETPFALRVTESAVMLEAAKQADRIFMVGLLERSIAQYQHVHEAAARGHLGRVLSITTDRLGSYLLSEETRKHYADPVLELMTLDFDFIRWMIGPPSSVYATALETPGGVPGEVSAILNYDTGTSVTVMASGIMPKGLPFSIGFRVLFEKGAFALKTMFEGAGPPKNWFQFYSAEGAHPLTIDEHDPYEQELRYFVNSILCEADPGLLDAQHAAEALKLSLATLQSAKEGKAISVGTDLP